MKKLLVLCCLLILSIGCTTNNSLQDTLYNHEYVIEVELVSKSRAIVYRIKYISDGYEVFAYVAAPADFMETLYPILIFNRGGNNLPGFRAGLLNPLDVEYIANRGYIVLASQYRGAFAGIDGMEQLGGDDINDVLNLINISESFYFAKQDGVFMVGESRGGMMTYIALRMDDRIKAAASWAGISNAFDSFNQRRDLQWMYTRSIGGTPDELPEEYKRRSAVM